MRIVEPATEDEMVALFLRTEIGSVRFSDELARLLSKRGLGRSILEAPNISSERENSWRRELLAEWRGWGINQGTFQGFPSDIRWYRAVISRSEMASVRYIDYDYWVELSGGTRLAQDAASRIRSGIDVFGVPSAGFMPLAEAVRSGASFPDLILVARDEEAYLVVMEGNARLTGYFLEPEHMPDDLSVIIGYSPNITNWGLY